MELQKFIKKQMYNHTHYANSFKKALSISNEHYHPKTGKIITWNEVSSLIDKDADKKIKIILKKIKAVL